MSDNLRGMILMVAAMAGFALEDMFIKTVSAVLPTGQILAMLGLGGALIFAALATRRGDTVFSPLFFLRPVMLRNLAEVIGTMGFVTAIVLTPLSSASAILQATPLMVTFGAALFFREAVGWRRSLAIAIGFAGVLMIIRPGMEGFRPASLFAVLGVAGLATRDLATRAVPRSVSSMVLSTYAFAMLVPTGLILLAFSGGAHLPDAVSLAQLGGGLFVGVLAYYAIVAAMRVGEVAVVTPFRYTRLIFALVIGVLVFDEAPDFWTLGGATLIIGSGLYTLMRELRLGRRRHATANAFAPGDGGGRLRSGPPAP